MIENKKVTLQQPTPSPKVGKVEASTLPLQIMKAAYLEKDIYSWKSENHSLIDENSLKKALLGNMMTQAFQGSASSSLKLIKRNYLPYQGG